MTEKIKVMMVDDETRFRDTTSTLLTRRGFVTTMAASGEEALSMIKKTPQDVVILDVKMEGMDGHAVLAEIKKIAPETQVIMLTGHGKPGFGQQFPRAGGFRLSHQTLRHRYPGHKNQRSLRH